MTTAPAPALRDRIVEFRRVPRDQLTPNPRNWRRHPPEQRAALDEVLEKIGIAGAVLAYHSERAGGALTLIDGALRQEDERAATWPTLITDLSDEEADHLLATYDPLSLLATTDSAALAQLLADVTVTDEAMSRLLADLVGKPERPGKTDPDDAPPAPEVSLTRRGERWTLGDHQLVIDDATKPAAWRRLELGAPALVFTDPPYGTVIGQRAGEEIAGNDQRDLALQDLVTKALRLAARAVPPDTAFYVWHHDSARDLFTAAVNAAGLITIETVLWIKPNFGLGYGHYRSAHEPCLYAGRAGTEPRWFGGHDQATVWRLSQRESPGTYGVDLGDGLLITDGSSGLWVAPAAPKRQKHRRLGLRDGALTVYAGPVDTSTAWEVSRELMPQHPTQKPVALARRAIYNSSEAGDLVLDPFAGSGSTLIAAEQTGRRARVLELDPRYADVILGRWALFTGRDPVRDDGASWSTLVLDRAAP